MKTITILSLITKNLRLCFIIFIMWEMAVTPIEAQWSIGPLLDMNLSTTARNIPSENIKSRILLGVGMVIDRDLEGNVDFRAEPMYLIKGWKQTNLELKYSASYIELPVMAKYSIPTNSLLTPYLVIGPSIGFLIDSKVIYDNDSEANRKDSFKKTDLGLTLGGGIKLPVDRFDIFTELRYVIGITDVNDVDSTETKYRNRGLNLVVGILF